MEQPFLLSSSKSKIVSLLLQGSKTAAEIALALKIQTSAARKHLEDLQANGIVSQEFRRAELGRPKKFYGLTENGKELFPRRYDAILNAVLSKLGQREGRGSVEPLMGDIAKDLAKTMSGKADRERIERVSEGLNELGFQASIKEDPKGFVVISENCPLLKTATLQSELVCESLHETLLKKTLGATVVNRESWILSGDSYCKHVLPKPMKPSTKPN